MYTLSKKAVWLTRHSIRDCKRIFCIKIQLSPLTIYCRARTIMCRVLLLHHCSSKVNTHLFSHFNSTCCRFGWYWNRTLDGDILLQFECVQTVDRLNETCVWLRASAITKMSYSPAEAHDNVNVRLVLAVMLTSVTETGYGNFFLQFENAHLLSLHQLVSGIQVFLNNIFGR